MMKKGYAEHYGGCGKECVARKEGQTDFRVPPHAMNGPKSVNIAREMHIPTLRRR